MRYPAAIHGLRFLAAFAIAAVLRPQDPRVHPGIGTPGVRPPPAGASFHVTFPAARSRAALDGRLLVILAVDPASEPRFQVRDGVGAAQVFGVDVEDWQPGAPTEINAATLGYPIASTRDVPAGDYFVQAVLNRYETFRRSDGHTVKLPPDRGEGQQWHKKPGNLYSKPQKLRVDAMAGTRIELVLDQEIPPIERPQDTKFVKHVQVTSDRLSKFWGRPVQLGANVLLPLGFDEHPDARYPLVVYHGHFPHTFGGFREASPDPGLEPDYSERFRLHGYNRVQQQYAHEFFQAWTGPDMPRFLIVEIQHANPFYDDSYAVNSANLGPYGDAIQHELIPEVERRFRAIGKGWARFTYGGSTGGWEALAVQTFHPDEYNGCFAACPDPIDFRAYTVVDIYRDENAYYAEGPFARVPRAGMRDGRGHVTVTLEQANHLELVLGTKSRSGQQWDIWEAVFSPCGADGYPKRIWDKHTGVIDREVAAYWREHYDLRHILQRDWKTLGPKLAGKIHLYCGTMDNYFLEGAVRLTEEFLEGTKDPHYGGEVDYGEGAEHCWNGDHARPNAISRLRYHQMYVAKILQRIEQTAPPGADTKSWRY
jgi:hypothetical protein